VIPSLTGDSFLPLMLGHNL